ncbi:type II secretion system F family protein [Nocardia sp. NPDC005366]|uniref:type II secretion system F family protein n=1 Tax=Nocardia sp. NPDC005366 TaxID=3156878 RepID=UPI0033A5B9BF
MAAIAVVLLTFALMVAPGRIAVGRRLRASSPSGSPPDTSPHHRARGETNDPLAAASVFDLLAACLRAGMPLAAAVAVVASGAPEVLREALFRASDLLALGADATTAWERAVHDARGRPGSEEIESLARMARRSARSGASLAVAIGELAEQRRGAVADMAAARAERAGVLIGGPLGLCFLPAFLCLGIVPVVIGLAAHVLGGGLF